MELISLPDAGIRPLSFYLAMEEYVAAAYGCGFFVWRVKPTVIIGRNQNLETEVNLPYCREHGIDVVRRKSGGGCVFADEGNLMLSYITPQNGVAAVFAEYLEKLSGALRSLGLDAVTTSHNDIMVGGYKVSGNAFFSLTAGSIVHGTLLHSVNIDMLSAAITPGESKLARHGVQSVRQRVANLVDLGFRKDAGELATALTSYFCDSERVLTSHELDCIKLVEKSYRDPAYILGKA